MSFLRLAVNTSLYAYHPLSLRMIVLKSSSKPVGDISMQTLCSLCPLWLNSKI